MDSEPPRRPGLFWAGMIVAFGVAPATAPPGGGAMTLVIFIAGCYMMHVSLRPPK